MAGARGVFGCQPISLVGSVENDLELASSPSGLPPPLGILGLVPQTIHFFERRLLGRTTGPLQRLLDMAEAPHELAVGRAQGRLGVDLQVRATLAITNNRSPNSSSSLSRRPSRSATSSSASSSFILASTGNQVRTSRIRPGPPLLWSFTARVKRGQR